MQEPHELGESNPESNDVYAKYIYKGSDGWYDISPQFLKDHLKNT